MAALPTYVEFLDLVVGGSSTPQDILNYHLPDHAQHRIEDLMAKSKEEDLTDERVAGSEAVPRPGAHRAAAEGPRCTTGRINEWTGNRSKPFGFR